MIWRYINKKKINLDKKYKHMKGYLQIYIMILNINYKIYKSRLTKRLIQQHKNLINLNLIFKILNMLLSNPKN